MFSSIHRWMMISGKIQVIQQAWTSLAAWLAASAMSSFKLTVCDALVVVVTLGFGDIVAHELKVNLVLDITHENKGRDHALAARGRHGRANLAIPDVVCAGEQGAHGAGGHGEQDRVAVVCHGSARADPVGGARISQVFGVGHDVVQRVQLVVFALAYWRRHTRLQGM